MITAIKRKLRNSPITFKWYKSKTLPKIMYYQGNDEDIDSIGIGLIWGTLYIYLNFLPLKPDNEYSEEPQYGFYFHSDGSWDDANLWLWWGKKYKVISFPWNPKWYRTSILLKDGSWEHEYKGDRKEFYNKEWKEKQWSEQYEYTYVLRSGEVQKVPTTIYVEEREWRRQGWMWCSLFNSVNKKIDVDFTEEVGEGRGSWKGGVLGCGYSIKKGETPLECLKRMERERKFDR